MKAKAFSVILATLAATGFAQSWSTLATPAELAAGNGGTSVTPGALAVNSSGVFALVDGVVSVLRINPSGSPKVEVMVDDAAILAAIKAANSGLSAASLVWIKGIGFNTAGQLIVVTDQMIDNPVASPASVLAIDPTPPYNVHCLLTDTPSVSSPLKGARDIVMRGNTAYVLVGNDVGIAGPVWEMSVWSVDTAVTVNDGSIPAIQVLDNAALVAGWGASSSDSIATLWDGAMLDGNTLLLMCATGSWSAANQSILKVDLSGTPTPSIFIGASNLATAIGKQVSNLAITTANGKVYLFDTSITSTYADGVITASSFTPPSCSAAIQASSNIASTLGAASVTPVKSSLAYDALGNRLVSTVTSPLGTTLISRSVGTTSAQDWSLME